MYSGKLRKCMDFDVGNKTTLKLSFKSSSAISFAFMVATEPETPKMTVYKEDFLRRSNL